MTITDTIRPLLSGAPERTPARRDLLFRNWRKTRAKMRLLVPLNLLLTAWYFSWLVRPARVGNPVLYGLLIMAEVFNLVQAMGFWWTVSRARPPRRARPLRDNPRVDVMIPVYNEPVDVVEATVAAASRLTGAAVRVMVCDDGDSDDIAALAERYGACYMRRPTHEGAKAGNLNHAMRYSDAPFVAVFDCDHIVEPDFLEATLGHFRRAKVAMVQTPQYYGNWQSNPVAAAAWSQQALFFGIIARGKDGEDSMFCCGTNVVYRREALESVGGIPESSVTEDFELSIHLQERGWRAAYVPEILATGLGPEDMASYISQQQRWSRGCLAAAGTALRSKLPLREKIQFLLSSTYFLTGWTYLLYMSLPAIRILTGTQALAGATSSQFLAHFAPYFVASMATVAVAGAGTYSFSAFALMEANFWIHIGATVRSILAKPARFVVTPKSGAEGRQPRAVGPSLIALAVLSFAAVYGLATSRDPGMLNNVAFAGLHISVIFFGIWPALVGARPTPKQRRETIPTVEDDGLSFIDLRQEVGL